MLLNVSKCREIEALPCVVVYSLWLLTLPKGGYLRHKTRNLDSRFLTTSSPGFVLPLELVEVSRHAAE